MCDIILSANKSNRIEQAANEEALSLTLQMKSRKSIDPDSFHEDQTLTRSQPVVDTPNKVTQQQSEVIASPPQTTMNGSGNRLK